MQLNWFLLKIIRLLADNNCPFDMHSMFSLPIIYWNFYLFLPIMAKIRQKQGIFYHTSLLTHEDTSMAGCFLICSKYYWRYVRSLVPIRDLVANVILERMCAQDELLGELCLSITWQDNCHLVRKQPITVILTIILTHHSQRTSHYK